jgi:hypothetical protein
MLQAARPRPMIDTGTVEPGSIRPTRASDQVIAAPDGTVRHVDELQTIPGTAAYRSKMPPPPCFKCGEDHVPNRRYDHPYMQEPHVISADPEVHQMIDRVRAEGAAEYGNAGPRITVTEVPTVAAKRVAVYVGKSDTYVVAVEVSPDWDTEASFKVTDSEVVLLVKLARALGVKVQDKTGGDLVGLEEESARKSS